MRLAARAGVWILPPLFSLAVYWPGLWAWFQQDDFAWLGLHLSIHEPSDFWRAMFAPMAQGTIRPLSERAFFLTFHALFGLDALPFRVAVFATQCVNLALLLSIVRRMTGSRGAALVAAIVWAANPALGVPMSWTSSYNQILCATFLLGAFRCWLQYVDSGQRRWYVAQAAIFVAGFGALEINAVYPALVAAHVACCARSRWRAALPLFVVSAAYGLLRTSVVEPAVAGPYVMHFDAELPVTLGRYWFAVLGASRLDELPAVAPWRTWTDGAAWLLCGAIAGFVATRLWRRDWPAAIGVLWFGALIAPVLPLRDHFSDYYLTLPALGLALVAGWAWSSARRTGARAAVLALAGIYVTLSAPLGRAIADYNRDRSDAVRNLVLGVARAHELHPGKTILLSGVGTDLFWSGVFDKPFRILGVNDVWLAPGSEENIGRHPELGEVGDFVFPAGPALRVLAREKAVVYAAGGDRLRNVTPTWHKLALQRWKPELARRVDAGNEAFSDQLGPGWYPIEGGYRWMSARAVVWLAGPTGGGQKLRIAGFCPAAQLSNGLVRLTIRADGESIGTATLETPDAPFENSFPLPATLTGREKVEFVLDVDRAFVPPGDGRQLGAAFGIISIR